MVPITGSGWMDPVQNPVSFFWAGGAEGEGAIKPSTDRAEGPHEPIRNRLDGVSSHLLFVGPRPDVRGYDRKGGRTAS